MSGERAGITDYQRYSISNYMHQAALFQPLLDDAHSRYEDLAEHRTTLSLRTVRAGEELNGSRSFVKCRPNIEPTAFHQAYIAVFMFIISELKLSLPEAVSVLCVYMICPHTAVPLFHVFRRFLDDTRTRRLRGFEVGYRLATLVVDAYSQVPDLALRFNIYAKPTLPVRRQWSLHCTNTWAYCLYVWALQANAPRMSTRDKVYANIVAQLQTTLHGMGDLTTKHSMILLSCFGILPPWVRDHSMLCGRPLEWIVRQYHVGPASRVQARNILSTLTSYFGNVRNHDGWTFAKTEMWCCKFVRILTEMDGHFKDVYHTRQPIFSFRQDGITMIAYGSRNTREALGASVLCPTWQFGNVSLSMDAIAAHMKLGDVDEKYQFQLHNVPRELHGPQPGSSVVINLERFW